MRQQGENNFHEPDDNYIQLLIEFCFNTLLHVHLHTDIYYLHPYNVLYTVHQARQHQKNPLQLHILYMYM